MSNSRADEILKASKNIKVEDKTRERDEALALQRESERVEKRRLRKIELSRTYLNREFMGLILNLQKKIQGSDIEPYSINDGVGIRLRWNLQVCKYVKDEWLLGLVKSYGTRVLNYSYLSIEVRYQEDGDRMVPVVMVSKILVTPATIDSVISEKIAHPRSMIKDQDEEYASMYSPGGCASDYV